MARAFRRQRPRVALTLNARAGHYDGWHIFGHNSPVARAGELFKPSTDSGSLVVSIFKKIQFAFGVVCV